MKKILIVPLFVLIFPLQALAISGACSSHSGVNCGAGPDLGDGSVICNDGWRDSSVNFLSTDECMDKVTCTIEQYNELSNKLGVTDEWNQMLNIANQMTNLKEIVTEQILQSGKEVTESRLDSLMLLKSQQLLDEYKAKESMYKADLATLKMLCHQVGVESLSREITEIRIKYLQSQQSKLSCPPNSQLNGSSCYCVSGYQWNTEKTMCIVKPQPNAQALTNPIYFFTKSIKVGSRGNDVEKLQRLLEKHKLLRVTSYGYFGSATRAALIKYQKSIQVKATGVLDAATRKYINALAE